MPTIPAQGRATARQINYILMLMARAGYSTRFMRAEHKELGASLRQRHGTVADWLASLSIGEASSLIEQLLGQVNKGQGPR